MSNSLVIEKLKSKNKINLPWIPIITLVCFMIGKLFKNYGDVLEKYYSGTINKWMIQHVSRVVGIIPFSLAEVLFVLHIILFPIIVGFLIYKVIKGDFLSFLYKILAYICALYVVFMLMWGFNYSRMSIGAMMDLETRPYTKEELYSLNQSLIQKANVLRESIAENSEGVMYITGGYKDVFSRSDQGYEVIGETVKVLAGSYGRPKSITLSRPMLYTGITGIYFPYTAEANVNTATSDLLLPATVLHEMAHQRGFASEDEANYIAYLTASAHPDIDFQYSGTMLALIHSMNALSSQDYELAATLRETYSEGLKRDIKHHGEFWKTYEGKVNETANIVNDTYLKSNGQEDGTKSYSKMVDLLLAHLLKYGEI